MRLCIALILAFGFIAAVTARAQDDSVKEEMKKLQGPWAQISVEANGKKLTDKEDSPKVTLTISGEKWIEKSALVGGAGDVSTFKINPAKNPKQVDLTQKGRTIPGIYTLEGDTFTRALPFPFGGDFTNIGKRPTEFRTKEGDGFVVITCKRVKP